MAWLARQAQPVAPWPPDAQMPPGKILKQVGAQGRSARRASRAGRKASSARPPPSRAKTIDHQAQQALMPDADRISQQAQPWGSRRVASSWGPFAEPGRQQHGRRSRSSAAHPKARPTREWGALASQGRPNAQKRRGRENVGIKTTRPVLCSMCRFAGVIADGHASSPCSRAPRRGFHAIAQGWRRLDGRCCRGQGRQGRRYSGLVRSCRASPRRKAGALSTAGNRSHGTRLTLTRLEPHPPDAQIRRRSAAQARSRPPPGPDLLVGATRCSRAKPRPDQGVATSRTSPGPLRPFFHPEASLAPTPPHQGRNSTPPTGGPTQAAANSTHIQSTGTKAHPHPANRSCAVIHSAPPMHSPQHHLTARTVSHRPQAIGALMAPRSKPHQVTALF